jgi:hypothetical protein
MPGQNTPAAPIEKLYTRMEQAQQFGKAFDENLERQVMGMEPVAGRAPITILENAERAKLTVKEDVEGAKELAGEAKLASAGEQQRTIALLQAQLDQQARQIAELTGAPAEVLSTPQPPPPRATEDPNIRNAAVDAARAPVTVPTDEPNAAWTRNQMYEWLKARGLALPPNPIKLSKMEALDYTLAEAAKLKAS